MEAGGEIQAVPATARSAAPRGERISGECGGALQHTELKSILGQWVTSGLCVRFIQTFQVHAKHGAFISQAQVLF